MATDSASHCNWYCYNVLDYVVKTCIHVNQNDKPLLSCGARVAVVTESEVEIVE